MVGPRVFVNLRAPMRPFAVVSVILSGLGVLGVAEEFHVTFVPKEVIRTRIELCPRKNQERQAEIQKLFAEAGCQGALETDQSLPHSHFANVVCDAQGGAGKQILVTAHFDKVHAGNGVIDNWSGAALLPSMFQSVSSIEHKHRFRFIAFCQEEEGLVGSRYYAFHLAKHEQQEVAAMVNLDSVGAGPTKVWTSVADKHLVELLGQVAASPQSPVATMNIDKVGLSDATSFRLVKVPTIDIHSITTENYHILHSSDDSLKELHMDDYYETYRLVAMYLAVTRPQA